MKFNLTEDTSIVSMQSNIGGFTMKMTQAFLVCICVFGATKLASSQVKAPTAAAIPGYLDPATGKFTTRIASAPTVPPDAQGQPAVAGTSVFFREDFQIQIQNFDQPSNATVICSVEMTSFDANGYFSESASIPATVTGGGWSCDVPVLTQWTLQNPNSDTISATVSVMIYTQTTPLPVYRSSTQTLPSLTVPANTQTVVNSVSFKL